MIELSDAERAVEATLFAAAEPMSAADIALYVGEGVDVKAALASLQGHYSGRGVELVERGGRWHFQTAADLAHILRREREESRSSAVPRSRRWRSSLITSRSAAPRSRRSAASRYQRVRWTC